MKLQHSLRFLVTTLVIIFTATPTISMAQSEGGHYIVITGTPASGKATNSEMLSKTHNIPWINIREEIIKDVKKEAKKGSNTAALQHKRVAASSRRMKALKAAVAKLEAGELVSDDSLNALVATEVLSASAAGGFILDGYPMTVAQAEFLDSLLELRDMSPLKVIYLKLPDEVSVQRMKERGRKDDKKNIGKERLRIFNSMIGPLVEYYGTDVVNEIDATKSEAEVAIELASILAK